MTELTESGTLTDETLDGRVALYSGASIRPLRPDPEDIHIEDIAHALSQQCRFTGHTIFHYSVGQHSVLASELVPEEVALEALLHDASEYVLADISRPIKLMPEFGDVYKKYERQLEEAIAERFGLTYPWPESVKQADDLLLCTEQRDLMPDVLRHVGTALPERIEKWQMWYTKHRFLQRYEELKRL